jgi:hypothetical protein
MPRSKYRVNGISSLQSCVQILKLRFQLIIAQRAYGVFPCLRFLKGAQPIINRVGRTSDVPTPTDNGESEALRVARNRARRTLAIGDDLNPSDEQKGGETSRMVGQLVSQLLGPPFPKSRGGLTAHLLSDG